MVMSAGGRRGGQDWSVARAEAAVAVAAAEVAEVAAVVERGAEAHANVIVPRVEEAPVARVVDVLEAHVDVLVPRVEEAPAPHSA